MMRKTFSHSTLALAALCLLVVFSSCSGNDYVNVMPANSTAVLAVDMAASPQESRDNQQSNPLMKWLHLQDVGDCGLDLSAKLYFFETADGNIGALAKVNDEDDLKSWLGELSKHNVCQPTKSYKDFQFTVVKDSWLLGYSNHACLVMGPFLPAQHAEARRQIAKYLAQEEEDGIQATPLFERLSALEGQVTLVGQTAALPKQFVAPFILGAPADAEPSQVMLAASFSKSVDGILEINGESFSFNEKLNQQLTDNKKMLKPIQGKYLHCLSSDAVMGLFLNVEGKSFIDILHQNKPLQALLAGVNTAIDMDNIIRSVQGDMMLALTSYQGEDMSLQMAAQLADAKFLDDVDYWKQSCPAGSRITDWQPQAYCLTNGSTSYYFGVSNDKQYFSGSTRELALASIAGAPLSLSSKVLDKVKGQRFSMILNVNALMGAFSAAPMVKSLTAPLLGEVNTVIINIK